VLVAEQPASGGAKKREVREMEAKGVRGVVTRVGRGVVGVAVEDVREEGGDGVLGGGGGEKRVWIVKVADEVTFRR
jgi:DNA polymerase alpha-associated DNA helicase A